MFIVGQRAIDDPELVDYGGRLMQWHVHENLCWRGGENGPQVAGVTDAEGNCPEGTVRAGGDNPMVHVWIAAHECGPFAALEGHGAGQAAAADGTRTDQCAHDDGHSHAGELGRRQSAPTVRRRPPQRHRCRTTRSSRSTCPGTPGVTPEQQAFAENLVSSTLRDLPQWSDPAVAEEAGIPQRSATRRRATSTTSSGTGSTTTSPSIPTIPRASSTASSPTAHGRWRRRCSCSPRRRRLDEVPDWGGPLMQWHVHSDLCFDVSDPDEPRVGGLTDSAGECTAPLRKLAESPMIHVWIIAPRVRPVRRPRRRRRRPGAAGEEHLCDHAHGSTTYRLDVELEPRLSASSQVRSALSTSTSLRDQTKRSTSSSTASA